MVMTINCKGTLIDLSSPKIMGILNLTPDSFYDGGKYKNLGEVVNQVRTMLEEGATFIDVGAYSSRPDATDISENEEEQRLIPVIEEIIKQFPDALISVDTFRSQIAKKAIQAGACIVNDISAGKLDDHMMKVVAELQVPYIMMHMRGTPQTMKSLTEYDDLVKDVSYYFSDQISIARDYKINDLIIDPGFGFAKTVDQNFQLLNDLDYLKNLEVPLLAGLSRKSMIYKTLKSTPDKSLNGTTALHMIALQNGASILRVHDVQPALECVKLYNALR